MGVSGAVGRWSVGSDGFLGVQPCRVCSGEPCGCLHLERDMSAQLLGSTACCKRMDYCARSDFGRAAPTSRGCALSLGGFWSS